MKKVLVPLAQGFEEIEFVSIVDVLRRANINAIVASLSEDLLVKGAHYIEMKADLILSKVSVKDLDAIALPGGLEGMQNLSKNQEIIKIIQELNKENKLVAAMCASPIVLNKAGVLSDEFSCYPGCEQGLSGKRIDSAVVERANIITSAGPATAILFALAIVKKLCGAEVYKSLYDALLLDLAKRA